VTTSTRQRGDAWERAAETFLTARGLKILQRNFHGRFGEIDLVLLDGDTLVFVEVRYRSNPNYGSGAASVTATKQRRIVHAAQRYLQRERRHAWRPCRFDVVSVGRSEGRPVMNWIRAAFEAG
jgi:putative endonuclease